MRVNFKQLIKEKKVKNVLVICIAIIAASILLYTMFPPENKEDKRNDKIVMVGEDASRLNFEVPNIKSNILEDGNKIDAFEKKFSDSLSFARKTEDALSLSINSSPTTKANNIGFTDEEFERMRTASLSNSNHPSNSHSTYGNSSMWSNDIPSGSNVGYSDLGSVINKPQASKIKSSSRLYSKDPEVMTDDIDFDTPYFPSYKKPEAPMSTINYRKSIKSKLLSTGFAMNGRSLSFITAETAIIHGEKVPKGQVVTGVAKIMGDRLKVKLINLKVNGRDIDINGSIIGFDGEEGIPIVGGEEDEGIDEYIKDQTVNQVSRIPVVGGIISSISRSSKRNRQYKDKVKLNQNTDCIIAIY